MACRLTELVIDCHDHVLVGTFWSRVLGYEITEQSDGPENYHVALQGPDGAGPTILVDRTPDQKVSKNRLHIDVNATDRSQDEEVERILALGATRRRHRSGRAVLGRARRPGGQRVLRTAVQGGAAQDLISRSP